MPVELRARHARPSYKAMFEYPTDEGGPPLPEDDPSSESAFELTYPVDDMEGVDNNDAVPELEEDEGLIRDDESDIHAGPSKSRGKHKTSVTGWSNLPSSQRPTNIMLAPGLPRPNARQSHALPVLSLNHRHRGIPLHVPPLQTLRLVNKPSIFSRTEMVLTRSVADHAIRERVAKAMSYNVGQGPVWELIEDRSWFKECTAGDQTRPIVYDTLTVEERWELLSPEQASSYLPKDCDESSHSPPMTCFFGPHDNQTKIRLNALQAEKMAHFVPGSKSHVFYAGAPVWAIDWCPVFVDDLPLRKFEQYLAVAPFPSHSHSPEIGRRVERPSFASIQIWSLSSPLDVSDSPADHDEPGAMKCELVLCIDSGPAHDLKWCPLPTHDKYGVETFHTGPRKLGLLGGTFEDGSLSLYVVPDPKSVSSAQALSSPLYVKLLPTLRIDLEDTLCWCMDWANSDLIAVGCTNGSIAIFRVKEALERPPDQPLRPTHYIALHQSAIRSLSWVRVPPTSASGDLRLDRDPTVLISGGYDGAQMVTDIRDLRGNLMNRTRDVINSIVFSHHVGGPLTSDHENMVKRFGMSPSTLGRGHTLLEPSGPVWSIATSDFHPQIAVGAADGTCQTTNIMKSTRKGGPVPFLTYKIFQLDYNRTSGEFRVLENFLPYEYQDRLTASRVTVKKKDATGDPHALPTSTGAWSPEISVTRVTWHSGAGLARSPLLASATASGLCRIDWLLGRFAHDRPPFHNIQTLRGEADWVEDKNAESIG